MISYTKVYLGLFLYRYIGLKVDFTAIHYCYNSDCIGNLFTEYFDFDDPCVYDDANDHGDNEDKLSAWNFLKGIGYDDRVKDPITGHDRVERREIVSHKTPNFLL